MTRTALLASLACSLIACSQDADIGVGSQPVTCADVGGAEVNGALAGKYTFGAVTPRIDDPANQPGVFLVDGETSLTIRFLCGSTAPDTYNMINHDRAETICPLTVIGGANHGNEYIQVETGTVIVDETETCLAGRFAIDFDDGSELSGWFSAPWR